MSGPRGPAGRELADDYPQPWRISTHEVEPGLWEAECAFGVEGDPSAGSLCCRDTTRFAALEALYHEMRTGDGLRASGIGFTVR